MRHRTTNLFNQRREFSKGKIISAERLCCCDSLLLAHRASSSGRLVSLIQPYDWNHATGLPNLQVTQMYTKHSFVLPQSTGASSSPWHPLQETSKTYRQSRPLIRSICCSFQIYEENSARKYHIITDLVGPECADLGWQSKSSSSTTLPICFPFAFCSHSHLVYTIGFAGRNSLLLCICIIRPVSKHCFNTNNNNTQLFNPWAYSKCWKLYSQKFKPFNEP